MALALLLHNCAYFLFKLAPKNTRQMATVVRKRLLPLPIRRNATNSTLQQAQKPHELITRYQQMSFPRQQLLLHSEETLTTIAGSGSLSADCKRRRRPCKAWWTLPYTTRDRKAPWTAQILFLFSSLFLQFHFSTSFLSWSPFPSSL